MSNEYGFVYIWFDRKHKRYYIGAHWGHVNDKYICSSSWMKQAYKKRPEDFKRRILATNIPSKKEMFDKEHEFLATVTKEELGTKYYNLYTERSHWCIADNAHTIAQKSGLKRRGSKLGPRPPEVIAKIKATKAANPYSHSAESLAIIKQKRAAQVITQENRDKRSASLKKYYADNPDAWKRIHLSKELA